MSSAIFPRAVPPLELWGGVECTVNRVRDRYFHQMRRGGHCDRILDLDLIAGLGVRTVRYPVLWEHVAPASIAEADWSWPDARLARLAELGIKPVAGLMHHGSGPGHTSLVDEAFPEKFAEYAGVVAARYPWLIDYTPVNEPLTTARFSALYGHWYPHSRNEQDFKTALFNQCRATVLAMRAIRRVNPAARLVQTEDLGKTYSVPALAYQAQFNNGLRWLSWDLLCGTVDRHHPMWSWLTHVCRASARELEWFAQNPCMPDVIGINHYVTSERVLDPATDRYPAHHRGGNGRECYADIEAARVLAEPTGGLAPLLMEAWQRYGIPMAVTECHIDSTREDQMRWLLECWNAAQRARGHGAEVRAVTAWALFGAYDWNTLVTEARGYYESGAFDVRGPAPRRTAVAALIAQLARDETPQHPVLAGSGWWLRPERFVTRPLVLESMPAIKRNRAPLEAMRPVLVAGARGTLGVAVGRVCRLRGLHAQLLERSELDIADADSVERALDKYAPWAVINAAGYVRVDDAEIDAERCFRENTVGPATLARACARHRLPFVTLSTDLVFDGRRDTPYTEDDRTTPLSVYGRSKAEAEERVLAHHPGALVVRTSAFFGPWDRFNFLALLLRALRLRSPFMAASDVTVSPTYVPDLVNACLDLMIDGESGIWHVTNSEAVTWAGFARRAAELARVDHSSLQVCPHDALRLRAPRPRYSAMTSARCVVMPSLGDALARFIGHWRLEAAPVAE